MIMQIEIGEIVWSAQEDTERRRNIPTSPRARQLWEKYKFLEYKSSTAVKIGFRQIGGECLGAQSRTS